MEARRNPVLQQRFMMCDESRGAGSPNWTEALRQQNSVATAGVTPVTSVDHEILTLRERLKSDVDQPGRPGHGSRGTVRAAGFAPHTTRRLTATAAAFIDQR
jgi:hypothetical protein